MDERRKGAPSPYQLVFFHGVNPPSASPPGSRLIPVISSSHDPVELLEVLSSNELTSADTKTTAVFVSLADPLASVVAYSLVVGFVGRFLDVSAGKTIEPLSATLALGRRLARQADGLREQVERLDRVVIAAEPSDEFPTVVYDPADPLAAFDLGLAAAVRFARRVTLVAPSDTHTALRLMVAVAGMRSTTRVPDRLPELEVAGELVDLEAARREARILRNQLSAPGPEQRVEAQKMSKERALIEQARIVPMEPVLLRLGSVLGPTGEFWRCPRPDNHANGDANPSMRISDGKVRCFVCDAEWVDPVQLVISARGVAPLEATRFVLEAASAAAPAA